MLALSPKLWILEQAAGHLQWKVECPPSQPVGSGSEPHWRPQPAKLPSFGRYSLETLPYLCLRSLSWSGGQGDGPRLCARDLLLWVGMSVFLPQLMLRGNLVGFPDVLFVSLFMVGI